MASLEFNLFDELENCDPRVDHFWRSRLCAKPTKSYSRSGTERSASKRIYITCIPTAVLDSSLKETFRQFGDFYDFRRHRDTRQGFAGFTYAHVTFDSVEAATKALDQLQLLDFENRYLVVKYSKERTPIMDYDNELPRHTSVTVKFQQIDVHKKLFFFNDGMCSVVRTDIEPLNPIIEVLEAHLDANQDKIKRTCPPLDVSIGEDVLACFQDVFYRALVLGPPFPKTSSKCTVWFTDYCNVEVVRMEDVRKLPRELKVICPKLGHLCQLSGVVPKSGSGFPEEALRWMTSQLGNPIVDIEVVGEREIPNGVVHLVKVKVIDSQRQNTFILSDELIRKGFGTSTVFSKTSDVFPIKFENSIMRFRKYSSFNRPFSASVVDFTSPFDLWVQEVPESDALKALQQRLGNVARNLDPPSAKPQVGDMVLARWTDGDQPMAFYRGVVLGHREDENYINVRFVDYGNHDDVHLREVRSMPENLAADPMQALHCSLALSHPPSYQWSPGECDKALTILEMYAGSDSVTCEVRGHVPHNAHCKFKVVLRDVADKLKPINDKIKEALSAPEITHTPIATRPQVDPGNQRSIEDRHSGFDATPSSDPSLDQGPTISPRQDFSHQGPSRNSLFRPNPNTSNQQPQRQSGPAPNILEETISSGGGSLFGEPRQDFLKLGPLRRNPDQNFQPPPNSTQQQQQKMGPAPNTLERTVPNDSGFLFAEPRPSSASLASNMNSLTLGGESSRSSPKFHPIPSSPTPAEKRLLDRVDQLERLVDEQNRQIQVLKNLVEAREVEKCVDQNRENRFEDIEAAINLLKRNHEALELDLAKKKIL